MPSQVSEFNYKAEHELDYDMKKKSGNGTLEW
jgi:hypothetical protein